MIQSIESIQFDLLVIGAGINGAGIARDASMRGLKVLLLDKGDIASGTSSWSTRLIHGGLRYLEYGELSLVRESLRERELLLHIAPHLVKPLPLIIPIYSHSKRGIWTIRAGMIAYDLLSFNKSLPSHRMLSRDELIARLPGIKQEKLAGGAIYYDAQVEYAERLVVENVLSAYQHGATVLTYTRVDQILIDNGVVREIIVTDLLKDRSYRIKASIVVNVAGPWVDLVLKSTGKVFDRLIGGTKGSHIIVDPFPQAPNNALYVEAKEDGRPFFIIPWNNRYLIGTTDTHYQDNLDHVEATRDEIDYLLKETNHILPNANLNTNSILYTYSGIRPLPFYQRREEKGITRRHFIHDHAPEIRNLFSIVGGKLTTYRSLSQETVDKIFSRLGRAVPKCITGTVPLPGASETDLTNIYQELINNTSFSELTIGHLLRVYGVRALEVVKIANKYPELEEIIDSESGAIGAEILFAFQYEFAQRLTDCILRRTMIGFGKNMGLGVIEAVIKIVQRYIGWDVRRAEAERLSYQNYIKRFHLQHLFKVN
jgi:glycerol-3-phosphate dehydrogenase